MKLAWRSGAWEVLLQLAGTAVPVRQMADPATLEMSEAASPHSGDSEIDTDVVQVQASADVGSLVHI